MAEASDACSLTTLSLKLKSTLFNFPILKFIQLYLHLINQPIKTGSTFHIIMNMIFIKIIVHIYIFAL